MKVFWYSVLGCIAFVFFLIFVTCFTLVPPGQVGVLVDLFGDQKGVESEELNVGMHWIAPWKKVYLFPVYEQNLTWSAQDGFNFQTKEGMAIHADVGITFRLDPKFVPLVFQRYRRGMDEISDIFIRNYLRDAINTQSSHMEIEALYGSGKDEFFRTVEMQVRKDLEPIGIRLSRIYLIGRFTFPQNVIDALNAKIEATQRAQQRENELREAEAQAQKDIAKARGFSQSRLLQAESEAKANILLAQSISKELLVYEAIQKWDGKLPQTMTGSEASLFLQKSTP